MLIEMLNILENFDIGALEHGGTEHVRIVAEAMKRATIDKDAKVGDPKFVTVPVGELTSKAYAKSMAAEIARGEKARRHAFQLGCSLQGHDAHLRARQGRQLFHHDPFAGHALGRRHAGPRLHVQRLHGRIRSAPRPCRLDRAGQGALQLGGALDPVQGRQAAPDHRCARRHADRHGRAARHPERARLRHDHGRGR